MAAASFSFCIRTTTASNFRHRSSTTRPSSFGTKIRCVNWDPEGILGPPNTGHIARREFMKRIEKDSDSREAFKREIQLEKERRQKVRESRVAPDSPGELIEYFLDTEAREIEFEISRLRSRLNKEFFSNLKFELGQLRFAVTKTQAMEDRLYELEALEKALLEGTEAFDKMQMDLVTAKERLTKILTSKDIKATLLDMVEQNEINRPLLTILDENIASAQECNQKEAAAFMEKIRGAMLKYITA